MHEPGLCEIALGGFETFDELTRIPIGRLTFLFGPNSAGKSSVEDGIRLLSEVCDTGDLLAFDDQPIASFESDHVSRRSRLFRAWRRTGDGADSYAGQMQIGASTLIDGWDGLPEDVTHNDVGTYNPPSPGLHLLDVIVRFRDRDHGAQRSPRNGLSFVLRDIAFSLDGVPFIEFADHAEAALNFGHPLLLCLPIPEACRVGERFRPAHVSTTGGWLRFRGGMIYDAEKRLDQRSYQESWRWNDTEGLDPEESWPPPPEMTNALSCFAEVFDRVLQNSCRVMRAALKPYTVPASRTTPEPRELSFLFDGWTSAREREHAAFHITMHGDQRYRRLASSFRDSVQQALQTKDSDTADQAERLHQRVNRMLTGHLFRERGYQLMADYRVLMTLEQFESRSDPVVEIESDRDPGYSLFIAIHLEDPQGRRHAFTEVGSGLGYVLPVLAAACDESLPVVVLQQPELHLHPALQAELGDVFVELSRGGRKLIIETHSEHLLLRVLKRLRQSGTATGSNPDLHVEPDDAVILYFDPHPDGTTKVKRLRVSADGEFLDRWPHGFFTERDEELFDE